MRARLEALEGKVDQLLALGEKLMEGQKALREELGNVQSPDSKLQAGLEAILSYPGPGGEKG